MSLVGTENRRYVYVIVRDDLEIQNKVVQVAHAAYDSAQEFKNHADRTSIIVLSPGNKSFNEVYNYLNSVKIDYITYTEQSLGLGKTAIATEAITEEQRYHMKKFSLAKF